MGVPLYLYDDARARAFEPFALTRPAGELRAGVALVRRRWEIALGTTAVGFAGAAQLADFEELDAPAAVTDHLPAGSILANARCIPRLSSADGEAAAWRCGGRLAAVRLAEPLDAALLADGSLTLEQLVPTGAPEAELVGRWADEVWDYVAQLGDQLAEDIPLVAGALALEPALGLTTIGAHMVYLEPGATIEPFVVFDVTAGPVLVRAASTVHAFTRIAGPCYIGVGCTVTADKIANCSIGDVSRVHGEMSTTIVLGHANKAHDGFVGHSYLGRWVNLGAGTTTSNLKNTYGTVQLWTPSGVRDSGLQFLGTLFGDHAKTGIGLRLTTGTVVGAGANVYGSVMPPKAVAPFAWGEGDRHAVYDADRFVRVAERAMTRRNVALGERGRRQLLAAHAARWSPGLGG